MLKLLHARAQAPVDAETNLSSPVIFAAAATKETTLFDYQRTDPSPGVQIAVRPSAAMFHLLLQWSDMHVSRRQCKATAGCDAKHAQSPCAVGASC